MKNTSISLFLSLSIIVFMIGFGAGYYYTPEYRANMNDSSSNKMDLGSADYFLDKRYLDQMISHHQAAIKLAEETMGKSERIEIKELAQHIIDEEPGLIEELYEWKKLWYQDKRSAPNPKIYRLGDKDKYFDLRFLNALIAHHQEGIAMAQEVKYKSSRSEILNNADQVIDNLSSNLNTLKEWRGNWY